MISFLSKSDTRTILLVPLLRTSVTSYTIRRVRFPFSLDDRPSSFTYRIHYRYWSLAFSWMHVRLCIIPHLHRDTRHTLKAKQAIPRKEADGSRVNLEPENVVSEARGEEGKEQRGLYSRLDVRFGLL